MNITISINKEFGELTDKKIERISSKLPKLINTQNINSQVAVFQFEDHALILNRANNEVAVAFGSMDTFDASFDEMITLLDLLDLDNVGRNNILIEDIEDMPYSVADASLVTLGLTDETEGVGLRFLVDTFGENPKEFKIEPRIDDFNKLYVSSNQTQVNTTELTKDFVYNSLNYLLTKSEEYKKIYLEKGGISGQ